MREKRGRERGEFYRGKVFSNGGLTLELWRAKKEKRKKKKEKRKKKKERKKKGDNCNADIFSQRKTIKQLFLI